MSVNPIDTKKEVAAVKQKFGIVGNSPALLAAVERAIRVAPTDMSVLVLGENGSGKEHFPRIIHAYSPRRHAKYIAVNCGAIPEGTIDSELFGHEKGAFTGAVAGRKGYFEEADGGTIFLDEVAELPLATQARLLRVLETGEYLRVGSAEVQKTNIRVVAATNADMSKAVADGKFREDLYYRLCGVQIPVPPLRERGGDIILLARKFASDYAEKCKLPPITFSESAGKVMLAYRWPGNVRQLKNVVEQIAIFEAGNDVSADALRKYLPMDTYSPAIVGTVKGKYSYDEERDTIFNLILHLQNEINELKSMIANGKHAAVHHPKVLAEGKSSGNNAPDPLSRLRGGERGDEYTVAIPVDEIPVVEAVTDEKEQIRRALENHDGSRTAAAKELKMTLRALYKKIKDYGLE